MCTRPSRKPDENEQTHIGTRVENIKADLRTDKGLQYQRAETEEKQKVADNVRRNERFRNRWKWKGSAGWTRAEKLEQNPIRKILFPSGKPKKWNGFRQSETAVENGRTRTSTSITTTHRTISKWTIGGKIPPVRHRDSFGEQIRIDVRAERCGERKRDNGEWPFRMKTIETVNQPIGWKKKKKLHEDTFFYSQRYRVLRGETFTLRRNDLYRSSNNWWFPTRPPPPPSSPPSVIYFIFHRQLYSV